MKDQALIEKGGVRSMGVGGNSRGFTLVEVLLAILVFSVSVLALGPLIITTIGVDKRAEIRAQVHALAASELDRLKAGRSLVTADTGWVTETRTVPGLGNVSFQVSRRQRPWTSSSDPSGVGSRFGAAANQPTLVAVDVSASFGNETFTLPNPMWTIIGR